MQEIASDTVVFGNDQAVFHVMLLKEVNVSFGVMRKQPLLDEGDLILGDVFTLSGQTAFLASPISMTAGQFHLSPLARVDIGQGGRVATQVCDIVLISSVGKLVEGCVFVAENGSASHAFLALTQEVDTNDEFTLIDKKASKVASSAISHQPVLRQHL